MAVPRLHDIRYTRRTASAGPEQTLQSMGQPCAKRAERISEAVCPMLMHVEPDTFDDILTSSDIGSGRRLRKQNVYTC